jgi:uncharacterized protein
MTYRRAAPRIAGLLAALILVIAFATNLPAQSENLPPKPDRYVTDQASVLDGSTIGAINNQLEQLEKDTSNQIVVAIYPSLPTDAPSVDQYTIDTYNAWQIGQKGKDNGALLMVFVNDHKMFICTGRGLEGALPDAICKNIVSQVIAPRFKQGDYPGGIQAGVDAMIAATKGEYKGSGTTVDGRKGAGDQGIPWISIIVFIIIFIIAGRSGMGFRSGPVIFTGGGWGGGGGGGFGGGGGGGGFSGGGGSSAGGGAGGGW